MTGTFDTPPSAEALARSAVLAEIRHERTRQVKQWGNLFDDRNTANDWVAYITHYAGLVAFAEETNACSLAKDQREQLVKVAALAVAAIEAIDRNGKLADRHYDS